MGFRELARAHNELNQLHAETRIAVVRLIGSHNGFVQMPFWGRVKWLLRGIPTPPPQPTPQPESRD